MRVLASLNHPNIVKYFETFIDEKSGKLQIMMEFCDVSFSQFTCRTLQEKGGGCPVGGKLDMPRCKCTSCAEILAQ